MISWYVNQETKKLGEAFEVEHCGDISYETLEGGVVLVPDFAQRNLLDVLRGRGGVCRADGSFVQGSWANFDGKNFSIHDGQNCVVADEINYIDEEVIYLGYFSAPFWAYGNYILDVISRFWVYLNQFDKKVKACYVSDGKSNLVLELARLFGLSKDNLIEIKQDTRFKRLIVPEQSIYLPKVYYDEFMQIIDRISAGIKPAKYEKIYLSRCKMKPLCAYGEKNIEKVFKRNGFKIVYPERLSLMQQIALMKGARVVAGLTGSAMHNVIFAREGIVCYHLNRVKSIQTNQMLIDEIKKNKAYYVDAYVETFPLQFSGNPFLLGANKNLFRFFDDNKFVYDKNLFCKSIKKDFMDFLFELVQSEPVRSGALKEAFDWEAARDNLCEISNLANYAAEMKKLKSYKRKCFFYKYLCFNRKKYEKFLKKYQEVQKHLGV